MPNIGYYPIKETEIKQTIKMIYLYYKKEMNELEQIFNNYNMNENKKKLICESFEKCVLNRANKYFDTFYGVCIAETQKIYRGHFNIEDKSITQLIYNYPIMNKYTKKIEEFAKFKNNQYEYINYLKFPQSSGVFIPYEKVQEIYNDYYIDMAVKKAIDVYYGNNVKKFIEILDYCLENNCGLLEAQIEEEKFVVGKNLENTTKINNSVHKKTEKNKVSIKKMTLLIMGFFILWSLVFGIADSIIQAVFTVGIKSIMLKVMVSLIIQGGITVCIWRQTVASSFKKKTIDNNDISKIMRNLTIFSVVLCIISAIVNFATLNSRVESTIDENMNYSSRDKIVEAYYNDKQKEEYYEQKEAIIENVKETAFKTVVVMQVGTIIINIVVLPFVKKEILARIN